MGLAVVHNGDRCDLITVDSNGNCRQVWQSAPGQSWTDSGTIMGSCVANATPVAEWLGGYLNIWVQGGSNTTRHWWYDGSAHNETLP